jgi:hypothetical protein
MISRIATRMSSSETSTKSASPSRNVPNVISYAPPVAMPEAVAPGTKGRKGAKVTTATPQQLFSFAQEENVRRGLFGTSAPNLFNGEDVDVPTYLRKGIRLPSAD